MAKATTLNVTGNREQLLDWMSLVEPEMKPVFTRAKKKKATSTFPEWQVDSMEEPSFDGVDEGTDVTSFDNKRANSARLGNYIQHFRRSYQVSNIQELVDTAGVKSEFAYGAAKAVRELGRDVESAICSSNDRQQQAGAGTPYKMRGFFRWLGYNGTAGNNYPSDIPADQQLGASGNYVDSGGTLTEDNLNTVMQNLYEANGAPQGNYMFVGNPKVRGQVSDFGRSTSEMYQRNEDATSKKMTSTITLYEGDFGIVEVVPASVFVDRTSGSATLNDDSALLLDTGSYCLFTLQADNRTELENQGGGRRGFCEMICSLGVESIKSHGFFYN
jgi:hypothetical protein